jgi:spermidine synthase
MINSSWYLLTVAFTSGAAVMAMEISAGRLLAPYFGTTLFVWTNIIGVVLIALSIGYYIGGRLADRRPNLNTLLSLILMAGLIGLIIPWAIKPLVSNVTFDLSVSYSAAVITFVTSLFTTSVLFAIPLTLLGMVSPFVIKLYARQHEKLGESAGRIFAVSTVGSILGTFLPTLWLIPSFGTKATIYISAGALILISGIGLLQKAAARLLFMLLIAIPITVVSAFDVNIKPGDNVIYEDESIYHYIRVLQGADNAVILSFNEGLGIQSIYNPDQIMTGYYFDYFNLLPRLRLSEEKKSVLIVGLAGGTISNQLINYYGDGLTIDGVELDDKVIDIAYQYFDLAKPNLTVHNQDGAMFLRQTEKEYDLIILDAYQRELYIPWNLTTQEFWKAIQEKLKPDGILALNASVTSRESEVLESIINTIASVFDHTYVTNTSVRSFNFMITASGQPILMADLINQSLPPELARLAQKAEDSTTAVAYDPDYLTLTDDHAPIEYMTEATVIREILSHFK